MHKDTATPYDDNTCAYQGLYDVSLLRGLAAARSSALLPVSRAETPDSLSAHGASTMSFI